MLNLFLWFILLVIISGPVLAYMRPHLLLKVIRQYAWLHPIENQVRNHMETLGLTQPASWEAGPPPDIHQAALPAQDQQTGTITTDLAQTPVPEMPPSPEQKPSASSALGGGPEHVAITADKPVRPIQPRQSDRQRLAPPARLGEGGEINADLRQLFVMAKRQYEERDLDSLEITLRKIIEKDPGAARAYHLLGTVYLERKDEEAAFRIFSEAVNLFPRDPMLHHDLGTLYYKRGLHELARQEFSKALEIAPHFPKAEQARQLLISLKQPGHVKPPPASPPLPPLANPDRPAGAPDQNIKPPPRVNPDPSAVGEEQNTDELPPPEAGGK